MEKVDEIRKLEHGDVVTINGIKYYCEQDSDWACNVCAFSNRYPCINWLKKEKLDCGNIILKTVNSVIKREQKKIRESQKLINKLSKQYGKI